MKNRVAYFGVFTALALIFSYIETLVPIPFGIPGVKLGLANLIIVIALYKIPLREVYVLSIVRVLLSGVLFGNYFSIAYSLAGGLLSLTVMALLKKAGGFSVIGISIAGGVCHNIGHKEKCNWCPSWNWGDDEIYNVILYAGASCCRTDYGIFDRCCCRSGA